MPSSPMLSLMADIFGPLHWRAGVHRPDVPQSVSTRSSASMPWPAFFRFHRAHRFPSSALVEPMSNDFVRRMEQYAQEHDIPVVLFDRQARGVKKDDIAQEYIARQNGREGVMFLGKAQEKTPVWRTERRRSPDGQSTYPWIVRSTAMVNHFYWYIPSGGGSIVTRGKWP